MTDEVAERIERWAREAADVHQLVLYDVETRPNWLMQVFVEGLSEQGEPAPGVSVDECARVSRYIEAYLDADEDVPEVYTLEVSSPGVERKLTKRRHYELSIGHDVRIVVHDPLDGKNVFEGQLTGVDDDVVRVREQEEEWELEWENIARARLTYDFDG